MIKTIKILTVIATFIMLSSFTSKGSDEFIGTYAVSLSDPSQIKLVINSDNTFYYQDFSMPDKKIVIHGTWTAKRGKVILKDNNSGNKFHNIWTFVENGQIAKSHKGLTFYRLCKMEA